MLNFPFIYFQFHQLKHKLGCDARRVDLSGLGDSPDGRCIEILIRAYVGNFTINVIAFKIVAHFVVGELELRFNNFRAPEPAAFLRHAHCHILHLINLSKLAYSQRYFLRLEERGRSTALRLREIGSE